jgi:hypothetical protein
MSSMSMAMSIMSMRMSMSIISMPPYQTHAQEQLKPMMEEGMHMSMSMISMDEYDVDEHEYEVNI